jgi:hypothetical protein
LRKCCLGQSEKSEVPYYLKAKTVIFFIPKIIVVFRTDLHKMKIYTELCCKRYDFFDKKDPKLSLSELLSYEKTIEKRRKKHAARLTYQAKSLPLQHEFGRVALP